MNIHELATFLGWCSVINITILTITTLTIVVFKSFITQVHSKMLSVEASELPKLYFQYLAVFKIAIIMLNIVPYFALKVML